MNAAAMPGGVVRPPKLGEITTEALWEEINTKVMGYLRCAREVAPRMVSQGWGRIVNVSGLAARQSGSILGSIRNVSVAALSKNLADELSPHGVTVTVVHPGATRTERTSDETASRFAGNLIGRMVEADEVAFVVAFLASPKSSAITGDAIAVGGGSSGSDSLLNHPGQPSRSNSSTTRASTQCTANIPRVGEGRPPELPRICDTVCRAIGHQSVSGSAQLRCGDRSPIATLDRLDVPAYLQTGSRRRTRPIIAAANPDERVSPHAGSEALPVRWAVST